MHTHTCTCTRTRTHAPMHAHTHACTHTQCNIILFQETVRKSKSKAQFHIIFLLAEIWTVYVERHTTSSQYNQAQEVNPLSVVKEFWSQLTPMLYLFIPHQKVKKIFSSIQRMSDCI